MTESDVTGHEPEALDRRRALKRLGLTAGAALAAPAVIDSFTNLAGAASPTSSLTCGVVTNGQATITVPADRALFFDLAGGGGGGGSTGYYSHNDAGSGGSGARVTGQIAPQPASYTLTVFIGTGGRGAPQPTVNSSLGGDGGQGYVPSTAAYGTSGGKGGRHAGTNPARDWAGAGGGGGGASAISSTGLRVIAGGGGAGGGAFAHKPTTYVPPASNGGNGDTDGANGQASVGTDTAGSGGRSGSNGGGGGARAANGGGSTTENGYASVGGVGGNGGFGETANNGVSIDNLIGGGGGGGGGGGAVGGGGGGGGAWGSNANRNGGGGGGGGGSSSHLGVAGTPVVTNTAGGTGGAGAASPRNSSGNNWLPGADGADGWVRLYLNAPGSTEPGESWANGVCT